MFKLKKKRLFLSIISILAVVGIVFFISHTLSQESYAVSAFTKVGEHTWTVPDGVYSVDVLVVAGGGGGGYRHGAGGGAGGVLYTEKYNVSPGQIINVVVGAGGAGATSGAQRSTNGENSIFSSLTAIGGGGGGQYDTYQQGLPGGSGGGSSKSYNAAGTPNQGNAGGAGAASGSPYNWGGGGGAGEAGHNGTTNSHGNGGDGLYYGDIFGNQYGENGWFGGGGGGGGHDPAATIRGLGGNGGGGDGGTPGTYQDGSDGLINTGGGGGGASTPSNGSNIGGNGGSGIVLVKYRIKLGTTQSSSINKGLVANFSMDADDYVEGTQNFVYNPEGKIVSNGIPGNYQPGWDTSLHNDAITVSNWASGYNSGVGSPSIGYHAKWVFEGIEGNSDPCMKFIDRNDVFGLGHRWLGISESLGTLASLGWQVGDKITISWFQKTDVSGKGANVGLYHKLISTGGWGFENNITTIYSTKINEWERVSFTTTIGSNWDLTSSVTLYFYGHVGAYGTLWVDNAQVEKKDHATPFANGIRVGRLTDSSPYGNHGTTAIEQSFTFTEDRFGKEGGAMKFDGSGTSDGVVFGNNVEILESITDTRNYPNGCAYSFWLNVDEDAVNGMSFLRGAATMRHIEIYSSNKSFRTEAGVQNGYSFGSGAFPENIRGNWAHFVIVFANNEANKPVRWYQNGELFYTGYMANGTYPDTEYFSFSSIGRSTGTGSYIYSKSFDGAIDDFSIYNRILSESEIKSLYNSYSPKTTTGTSQQGLVLDMPLKLKYTKSEAAGSEIMTDRTPYSHDGQNYGATITSDGASFDGVNDYIEVSNTADEFELGDHTFSIWTKSQGVRDSSKYIVCHYNWRLTWINDNTIGFSVGRMNDSSGPMYSVSSIVGDKKTEWIHLAGIYKPSEQKIKFYVDGEPVGETSIGSNIIYKYYGGYSLLLADSMHGSATYYNGQISNLLIYNRALSDEEIKTIYDKGRDNTGIVFRPYGSSQDSPGISCKDILENNPSAINLDGLYWINPNKSEAFQAYCDMTTDGGGWTLVLLSNMSKQYCPNVNWESVVNNVNYNGALSANITTFDLFMGLKYWNSLGTKLRLDMGSNPNSLTHRTYQDFSINTLDNYKISMANQVISIGGSSSGLYSYHNNRAMTTYDADNDSNSGNCSTFYNNSPWWYTSCWSGNFWGGCGVGYQDGPFWTGSGSEYFNYGSMWVR